MIEYYEVIKIPKTRGKQNLFYIEFLEIDVSETETGQPDKLEKYFQNPAKCR